MEGGAEYDIANNKGMFSFCFYISFLGVFSWCDLLLWKSQLFWIWLFFFSLSFLSVIGFDISANFTYILHIV